MLQGVCYRLYATEEADQGIYRLLEMANKETSLRLQLLYWLGKIRRTETRR